MHEYIWWTGKRAVQFWLWELAEKKRPPESASELSEFYFTWNIQYIFGKNDVWQTDSSDQCERFMLLNVNLAIPPRAID